MKKITLLTSLALCFTLVTIIGCSSDSPTDSDLVVGDTTSEAFQFVSDSIGDFSLDIVGVGLEFSFELLEGQFPSLAQSGSKIGSPKATADTSIVVSHGYSYSGGWHIFEFSATIINFDDTTIIEGLDSIQTLVNDDPVQIPDSTMNGLKIRNQYGLENNVFGTASGHQSLDLSTNTFDSLGQVTINGTTHDTLDVEVIDNADTCNIEINNNVVINDVVMIIDAENDCPLSGSVVASQAIAMSCVLGPESAIDSLNIEGSWTVSLTFNGTSETITYTNGNTTWTITETCGPNTAAPSFSGFSHRE